LSVLTYNNNEIFAIFPKIGILNTDESLSAMKFVKF